jgi:copper oxidase (laccase) domain-containing protein
MFFSKNLEEIDHCFFSKLGGVSTDQYYSLNCGKGSNDNKANINIINF